MNSPRVQNASWSAEKDTLTILSRISVNSGRNPVEIKSAEVWVLKKRGNKLEIRQTVDDFMGSGERKTMMIYDKLLP